MSLKIPSDEGVVDPDPFVITATCLAAAGVALQFIQTFHLLGSKVIDASNKTDHARTPLYELQKGIREFEDHLADLERSIRDGTDSPEKEFYDREFGVKLACFSFKSSIHQEYTKNLSDLIAKLSNFSLWANLIIGQHPDIGALIGREMLKTIADADLRINSLIRRGATNQEILAEARMIVQTCRMSADLMIKSRRN